MSNDSESTKDELKPPPLISFMAPIVIVVMLAAAISSIAIIVDPTLVDKDVCLEISFEAQLESTVSVGALIINDSKSEHVIVLRDHLDYFMDTYNSVIILNQTSTEWCSYSVDITKKFGTKRIGSLGIIALDESRNPSPFRLDSIEFSEKPFDEELESFNADDGINLFDRAVDENSSATIVERLVGSGSCFQVAGFVDTNGDSHDFVDLEVKNPENNEYKEKLALIIYRMLFMEPDRYNIAYELKSLPVFQQYFKSWFGPIDYESELANKNGFTPEKLILINSNKKPTQRYKDMRKQVESFPKTPIIIDVDFPKDDKSYFHEIDFLGLTKFLENMFEHIKEFVAFTNEVVNRSKQNTSRSLLSIVEEVFKETGIELKLEGFFKEYTINYIQCKTEFGVMDDAYIVALDINDIIKNLKAKKIDSTRLAYTSKKSAESMKKFTDRLVNNISERNFFTII